MNGFLHTFTCIHSEDSPFWMKWARFWCENTLVTLRTVRALWLCSSSVLRLRLRKPWNNLVYISRLSCTKGSLQSEKEEGQVEGGGVRGQKRRTRGPTIFPGPSCGSGPPPAGCWEKCLHSISTAEYNSATSLAPTETNNLNT